MAKNCSTCRYNVNNVCENTDWKDGTLIDHDKPPECGYLLQGSQTPMGYSPIKPIHIIFHKE